MLYWKLRLWVLTSSLPWCFPSHYDSTQCHWQLCHSSSCPVGTKTVLRKNVQIPRKLSRFDLILREISKAEGRCQSHRCFSFQWKAISCIVMHAYCTDKPPVVVWNYSNHSTIGSGAVRSHLEKAESTYNRIPILYHRVHFSLVLIWLLLVSFLEMIFYWERQEIADACSQSQFCWSLSEVNRNHCLCSVESLPLPGISFSCWSALRASQYGNQIATDVILVPVLWILFCSAIPC